MTLDVLKFVLEKTIQAKMKENIVDAQLFKCYSDIYFDLYNSDECTETTEEMVNNMLNGIKLFDSYGNSEKIYASLCVFCNKLLTKDEYRKYADLLVKKMVAYNELSLYVDIPVFKEKIMEDFDPDKVKFKRTNLMIYNNYAAFIKLLSESFETGGYAVLHNIAADTYSIPNMSSYKINLSDKIYAYICDTKLKITRLDDSHLQIDPDRDEIKVTIENRGTIFIGNKPLTKKSK